MNRAMFTAMSGMALALLGGIAGCAGGPGCHEPCASDCDTICLKDLAETKTTETIYGVKVEEGCFPPSLWQHSKEDCRADEEGTRVQINRLTKQMIPRTECEKTYRPVETIVICDEVK